MLILPSSPDADYTQTLVLDNVSYDLRLQHNPREVSWYLYIGLAGQPYAAKTKVVNGWDILKPFKHLVGIPQGLIMAVDTVASWGRINREEFQQDKRFIFVYITEAEIA